jgi:large subunit ribosomal protein L37Ae
MSQRTKKIGSTGWMGARYGLRIRRRVAEIDRSRSIDAACPKCATVTVRRISSGVFQCRRCHTQFASGAYLFTAAPPIARSEDVTSARGSGKA